MGQLTNQYVSSSYQGLLKMTDSTQGLTNTLQTIQTGDGDNSPLQMSLTQVNISGSFFINNVPITNGTNGTSGSSGSDGSSGTSGSSGSNGSSGTSGSNGSSGTSGSNGSDGSSGTSGASGSSGSAGSDGSSGTSGSNGTDGSSGTSGLTDKTGLITTGSIVDTQQITGSLILGNTIISGSLIGNTVNSGLIKIQTEANRSGSIQFENYITSSSPVSQSNIIMGPAGLSFSNQTGSVVISGSNNIILNGGRTNTLLTAGTYGYIGGGNNIISVIPTIATGSLSIGMSNNQLNGAVLFDGAVTSSYGTGSQVGTFSGNFISSQGGTTFRHKSGSFFNHQANIGLGSFTSFATSSWFDDQFVSVSNTSNIFQGSNTIVLNVSSSVQLSRNLFNSNNTRIENRFTNTNNYLTQGSGSLTLSNNIFGGINHTILSSGSNTANRNITNNLVVGSGILLNQISSGSFNTVISNTSVLGANLIISGSNNSTTQGGSTFVGRYNATGSLQESTNETVFVVGTGTSDGNRRNALRIDNSNNSNFTGSVNISGSLTLNGVAVAGSDRNGLITTGSIGSTQNITGSLILSSSAVTIIAQPGNPSNALFIQSGSMRMSDVSGSIRIATANNQPQLFFNQDRRVGFFLGQCNMDQVNTQFGITDDSTDNYTMGGNFNNFRTGSNNLMLGVQSISLRSGSNNIILARDTNYNTGSNNLILGRGPIGLNECQEYFNLQLPNGGTPIMFMSGSAPLTLNSNTTISGSLNVTNKINELKIWTGSLNSDSIGIGTYTLNLQTGSSLNNVAIGNGVLANNITGSNIVAIGNNALYASVAGFNLALGGSALSANTTGQWNIAIGQSSYQANTIGEYNTAIGWNSGVNNLTGSTNTIIGAQALQNNISGSGNVAIGRSAGFNSTGSNGFYVGNENYGSLNDEQNKSLFYGQFNSTTANQSLQINANTKIIGDVMFSSGSNKTIGTVALDGGNPGAATVSNSLVTANSLIFLTKQTLNHTNGYVAISSKGSSTFTITSNHNGDTDTVAYQIINPA